MADPLVASGRRGLLPYRNAALKAAKQTVKASRTRVYGWKVQNLDNATAYLHLYDALEADVTVGTTVPTYSVWLPASGGDDLSIPEPLAFDVGLVVAATTGLTGSTAPTNGELVNLFYF